MKILAITNLYPNPLQPHRAVFNRHRFRFLAQHHDTRLIAPIGWREELELGRTQQARIPSTRQVVSDGIPVSHPKYWYTPRILRGLYGRFYLESVRRIFNRMVEEFKPDIVFATWAYPDGWAAVRLARTHGLPVAILVHGSDIRRVDEFEARRQGTREALARADGVIAVSADLGRSVVGLGANPESVRVILDGVDKSVFVPGDATLARQRLGLDPGRRHLLFIGNLVEVKGLDILLQACARLDPAREDWELHLVGDGHLRGSLAQLADSLGIAARVRFHGSRPQQELPGWLHAADLFVLPSRSEGVPNVLLEASACGTQYVASHVGGIPEIASLGASTLVPPEDPEALSAAIAKRLAEPATQPSAGPRDRREAVADIGGFLEEIVGSARRNDGLSRRQPE